MAWRAGESMAETPALMATRTYTGQTIGVSESEFQTSPAAVIAKVSWEMTKSLRRLMASASAPPTTDTRSKGTNWANPSKPTASVESVSWKIWTGAATTVIIRPACTKNIPAKSQR